MLAHGSKRVLGRRKLVARGIKCHRLMMPIAIERNFDLDPVLRRRRELMRLIARGYSNKEIAGQLQISVKTVETQKATALRKLNISGRNEIVSYAILQGWLQES